MEEPTRPDFLTPDERLRWVPGYEGGYAATDAGRVISYKRNGIKEMSQQVAKGGYLRLGLRDGKGQRLMAVHQIIMLTFEGPPGLDEQIRHIDGDPSNNHLNNLCYGTAVQNWRDRIRHGNDVIGSNNPRSKLTHQDVLAIRRRYKAEQPSQGELAAEYGVARSLIGQIVRGEVWAHVGGPTISLFRRDDHGCVLSS